MPHRSRHLAALVGVLTLVTACSTSGGAPEVVPVGDPSTATDSAERTGSAPVDGQGTTGGQVEAGSTTGTADADGDGPSGLLIAEGNGYLHTYDLAGDDGWQQRLSYAAPWSTVAFAEQDREVLVANTSGAEPVVVTSYDVDTFGQSDAFEWPESTHITTLHAMAATHDGDHLALVMEPLRDPYLEVVDRSTGEVVYTGLNITTGAAIDWTSDDRLVVPIDLSHEENPDRWGAIAAFSLTDLEAAPGADVDGQLITTFTRAEWDGTGVEDLTLAPDDSELVYELAGDLWAVTLEPGSRPHQLTTGAPSNFGPAYSPDGGLLALVSASRYALRETFVIDNHRGEPVHLDAEQEVGTEFLLESGTLVEAMVAWLP